MKKREILIITLTSALIMAGSHTFAQKAEELLPKAIQLEEVKGELEKAIGMYQTIVDNFPDNRPVAAKAFYHMGVCYEKLGLKEAQKAYGKVVNNYPDQKNLVALAKERLNRLSALTEKELKTPLQPKFTKIEIPTKPGNGVLSPDGKKLAFTSDSSIWVVPLQGNAGANIAGEPVRIAVVPGVSNVNNLMAWSANGSYLAVNSWFNEKESVYLVPVNGGDKRMIDLPHRSRIMYSDRLSLSPDGETLAYSAPDPGVVPTNRRFDVLNIYTISIKGGESRKISSGHGFLPSFSKDGKFITYVNLIEKKETSEKTGRLLFESELWLGNTSGDSPVRLTVADGGLRGPIWSPDGNYIASLSRTESGGKEISVYPVSQDRKSVDNAIIIPLPGISTGILTGWTPSNEIGVFIQSESRSHVFTVPAQGGKAMQVTGEGNFWHPRWSPDGKQVFLECGGQDPPVQIGFIPAAGGSITKIPWPDVTLMPVVPGNGRNLSPDGNKLVVNAAEKPYNSAQFVDLWIIPLKDGHSVRLTNDDSYEMYPCWSPDGKWIAFVEWHKSTEVNGFDAIYKIPAGGGEPVRITSVEDSIGRGSIAFTPDGKKIAYFSGNTVRTIAVNGGKSEVLLTDIKFNHTSQICWTSDGSRLAYNHGGKIWIADLATGQKTSFKTGLPDNQYIGDFDWSPDGQKFTFTSSTPAEPEFWLVSNFLPPEKPGFSKSPGKENEVTIKQIWAEGSGDFSVSADGEFLSCMDVATMNLAFRSLRTGEIKTITNDGSEKFKSNSDTIQYPEFSLISPDGEQVAYLWSKWFNRKPANEFKPTHELRIVRVGDFKPVTLYTCKEGELLSPELWFSDGKRIIVQTENSVHSRNKLWQLYMVDITNGEFRLLKESDSGNWSNLALSPDEKYLAYDFPIASGGGKYDIRLFQFNTRNESALIENPANDRLIGWMPGTNKLLFTSDRSGTTDLWAISVSGDGAKGLPTRILNNTGSLNPIGFTASGSLYFSQSTNKYEAFIVPFDSEKGKITINTRKPLPGQVSDVCWLPGGESMILVQKTQQPGNRMSSKLVVYNIKTGLSRPLAGNLDILSPSRLSPDGKSVLAFAWDNQINNDKNYRGEIDFIHIETGLPTRIKTNQKIFPSSVEWDNGGENIFYPANKQIIKHNIQTGEEKTLFTDEHPYFFPTLIRSSDGHRLIFNTGGIKMISVPEDGGEAKTICKYGMLDARFIRIIVSPDGKYIYFTAGEPGFKSKLCRIPSTGGTPETLWRSKDCLISGISVHPEGKQIALSIWESGTEIRAIENLDKKVAEVFSQTE